MLKQLLKVACSKIQTYFTVTLPVCDTHWILRSAIPTRLTAFRIWIYKAPKCACIISVNFMLQVFRIDQNQARSGSWLKRDSRSLLLIIPSSITLRRSHILHKPLWINCHKIIWRRKVLRARSACLSSSSSVALQPRVGPWPPLRVSWQVYYDVGYQPHNRPGSSHTYSTTRYI
jgi:hypothetical protein